MIKLIPGADYYVRYVPLPKHIGGVTVLNEDGTFDIYINVDKPLRVQWESYQHELAHIQCDHLYRDDMTTEEKETDAERFVHTEEFQEWLRSVAI